MDDTTPNPLRGTLYSADSISARILYRQLQQDSLDGFFIRGDTRQQLDFRIQAQGDAHIFQVPGVVAILLVGSHHIRRGRIGAEGFQDAARFAEGLRAGAVDHHDKAQHALGEDFPHEVETLLTRRAEQIQHQVLDPP